MSAASQVATSSQSLSQGATEQAASLEETSASMEEMASMTRKNVRERPPGGDARHRRGAAGRRVERGAGRDGHLDVGDPRVEQQGRQDHQDDRRDRLPDEHPGAQRRGRSGPRRRGRHGLRGGRRRSPQPGAALGAGGQGHRRADRGIDRPLAGRHRQGRTGRQRDRDDHQERQPGEGHRPGSARGQPPADAGHRPGDAGHLADGEGDPDHRGDGGRERGGQRGAERPGRRLDGGGARARDDGRRRGAAAGRGRGRRRRSGGGRRPDPGGHGAEAAGAATRPTAEEQIPFGDTGTFGKF